MREEASTHIEYVVVYLCDVVGYSKMDEPVQIGLIETLWNLVRSDSILERYVDSINVSGAGDGLYLALWTQGREPQIAILEFAERMATASELMADGAHLLRGALHLGKGALVGGRDFPCQLVGGAFNECARLISFAEGGQVVISDDFMTEFKDLSERRDVFERAYPRHHDEGLEVRVKHGVIQRIKLMDFHSEPVRVPPQLSEFADIQKLLHRELEGLALNLSEHCGLSNGDQFRATLFRPLKGKNGANTLESTPLRYPEDKGALRTIYYGKKPGRKAQGIATCMDTGRPMVVRRLPRPGTPAYFNHLLSKYDLPRELCEGWMNRSVLAVPVRLSADRNQPILSVVTLDSRSSLGHLSSSEVDIAIRFMEEYAVLRIALLWKLLY